MGDIKGTLETGTSDGFETFDDFALRMWDRGKSRELLTAFCSAAELSKSPLKEMRPWLEREMRP